LKDPVSRILGLVEEGIDLNLDFPDELEIFEVVFVVVFEVYCFLFAHFVGEVLGKLLKT
jgi:hypothetical protein